MNRIFTRLGIYNRKIKPSRNRLRFADAVYESLGSVSIPLKTPAGTPKILVELDIVQADVPALLGLDILDKESLTPCTVSNRLYKRTRHTTDDGKEVFINEWYLPLTRSPSHHLYAPMDHPAPILFTRTQLGRLHRQFFHPSATKLFNLLKRSRPGDTTPETLKTLKELSQRCDPCQRIQHAPTRFRVSLGSEEATFNERILLEIMYLDGKPVLHIVDDGTKFGAAHFLSDISTETIWNTIVKCWASIYTGLLHGIIIDQGSHFGSKFIKLCSAL